MRQSVEVVLEPSQGLGSWRVPRCVVPAALDDRHHRTSSISRTKRQAFRVPKCDDQGWHDQSMGIETRGRYGGAIFRDRSARTIPW